MTAPPGRVAVIGDVAGHLDELRTELGRLGADPGTGRLPDDLTVVQVGDLVHRGPASDGVVALVDSYLTDQPGRWVQLAGNHEAQYLREPAFDWPERIGGPAREALRRWWAGGRMRAAVAVTGADGEDVLVTHAGLTAGFWRTVLGGPDTAAGAVAAIDALIGTDEDTLFRAGTMLRARRRSDRTDPRPGPVWACAGTELLPGWLGTTLPFSQVHGHDSVFDRALGAYRTAEDAAGRTIADLTLVDERAGHEVTTLPGGRIVGVDPGHGRRPRRPWRAWELRGRVQT
jgi:hypothetical protein